MNCETCKQSLSGVWPEKPWHCAFCDEPLCVGCYVGHTESSHFDEIHTGIREKLNKEKLGDILISRS